MARQRYTSRFTHEIITEDIVRSAARINYVMFSLVWALAPILVSLTAFFTFVMQGNQLTVGTAFTVGDACQVHHTERC